MPLANTPDTPDDTLLPTVSSIPPAHNQLELQHVIESYQKTEPASPDGYNTATTLGTVSDILPAVGSRDQLKLVLSSYQDRSTYRRQSSTWSTVNGPNGVPPAFDQEQFGKVINNYYSVPPPPDTMDQSDRVPSINQAVPDVEDARAPSNSLSSENPGNSFNQEHHLHPHATSLFRRNTEEIADAYWGRQYGHMDDDAFEESSSAMPYDSRYTCPKCHKCFRANQIQMFKYHLEETCKIYTANSQVCN